MEAFIVSWMMSALPYFWGVAVVTFGFVYLGNKLGKKISAVKVSGVALLVVLGYAATLPSNTYKLEAKRKEVPSLSERIVPEVQLTKPLMEQGKEERQKRFDDLTSWRKDVE